MACRVDLHQQRAPRFVFPHRLEKREQPSFLRLLLATRDGATCIYLSAVARRAPRDTSARHIGVTISQGAPTAGLCPITCVGGEVRSADHPIRKPVLYRLSYEAWASIYIFMVLVSAKVSAKEKCSAYIHRNGLSVHVQVNAEEEGFA